MRNTVIRTFPEKPNTRTVWAFGLGIIALFNPMILGILAFIGEIVVLY